MKNLSELKADLLAAMTAEQEPKPVVKAADDVLDIAIAEYMSNTVVAVTEPAVRAGKTIKEKGIAMTCTAQGGPANLRPVSLLVKANITDLTEEQRATLQRLGYQINAGEVA